MPDRTTAPGGAGGSAKATVSTAAAQIAAGAPAWPVLGAAAAPSWQEEAEARLAASHPSALELDVGISHLAGAGIGQLSMAQLDVLEELHHAQLSAVAAARLHLVREQEAERHAEQTRLAGELALC